MQKELNGSYWALRVAFGAVPIVAGLDKYFNLLTHWDQYVSPLAGNVISPVALMHIVGVVEIVAGVLVLSRWTRLGAYVVMAWLLAIALNLLTTGKYFDIAARDVVLSIAAFTLAKLEEVRLRAAQPSASQTGKLQPATT